MSSASGLGVLCAAFTAGISLAVVVVDSTGPGAPDSVRIETATDSSSSALDGAIGDVARPDGATRIADDDLVVVARVDGGTGGSPGSGTIPKRTSESGSPTTAAPTTAATPATDTAPALTTAATTDTNAPTTTATDTAPAPTTAATTEATAPSTAATTEATAPTTAATTDATAPSTAATPTTADAPPAGIASPATAAPPSTPAPSPDPAAARFESIRNRDPLFTRFEGAPASRIGLDQLTETGPKPDNGASPEGQFRMACNYSHFSYDDPIVFPGQPGRSHLHMFFGNTRTDAFTTTDNLVNSGGGSCNGFELNRSAYWTPALLDGKGNVVVPDRIILYYKTKHPGEVQAMPQGLKMVAGNVRDESFRVSGKLGWSCGTSGTSYNKSNRIPNNCGSDPVNAYIQFPFCWDGKNLDSADHQSHLTYVNDNQSCPSSHPVRLPQISILLYFPAGNTDGWYLSSDRSNGFNTGPGATLHADWFGGWNDAAMDLWIDGCMRRSRNCSFGQTGTPRMFARLNPTQEYKGDNFLPLPS